MMNVDTRIRQNKTFHQVWNEKPSNRPHLESSRPHGRRKGVLLEEIRAKTFAKQPTREFSGKYIAYTIQYNTIQDFCKATNQLSAAGDLGPLQHYIAFHRKYIALSYIKGTLHWIALQHYFALCLYVIVQWCGAQGWLGKGLHSLTLHQREEEVEKGKLYNNTFNDQYTFIIVTIIITNNFKSRRENQHI